MTQSLTIADEAIDRARDIGQLRAVDYLRVSTEEQVKGYGIAAGAKKAKKYIARKDWRHVDTFKDEGVSGSLPWQERDDMRMLMELAHETPRPFDLVVVPETRAIGRKDRVFWRWVWELQDLGIFVAIVDKDIDNTTEEGEAVMREEANYAFKEYVRIRTRTQSGVQEKAEEGGYTGGQPPFGWRIKNKGAKGESALELDAGGGGEHERLAEGRRLIVRHKGDFNQAAAELNAAGQLTRSGVPWSRENLRGRLLSDAVLKAQVVFRDPASPDARGGRGVKLGKDGTPLHGKTVVIKIPPAFTEQEIQELKDAVQYGRASRPREQGARVYPLSRKITSLCGAHYVGQAQTARGGTPWYRCSNRSARYPGAPTCDCGAIDAQIVEKRVWDKVAHLLQDPVELQTRAKQWLGDSSSGAVDFDGRLAELDKKIKAKDRTITLVRISAAEEAAERYEDPEGEAAIAAVREATATLREQRERLVKDRADVAAWKVEQEAVAERSRDLVRLAEVARERLQGPTEEERAEIIALLGIKLTILSEVPRPLRKCPVGDWFRSQSKAIPILSDAGWAAAEPLILASEQRPDSRLPHRQVLQALLCKAATGAQWVELSGYGSPKSLASRWRRWAASGLWGELVGALDALEGAETVPLPELMELPRMAMEAEIIPGLIIESFSTQAGTVLSSTTMSWRATMTVRARPGRVPRWAAPGIRSSSKGEVVTIGSPHKWVSERSRSLSRPR